MDILFTIIGVGLLVGHLVTAVVTALKGKWGMFIFGLFIQIIWWIGAIRLAKPDSFWARRFYSEEKREEARLRHGGYMRTPTPPRTPAWPL